jgi:two-component system response regulator LytT
MKPKMKAIIVEDDMVARMTLFNFCHNHPDIELEKDFDNAPDAIQYLDHHNVDLILLDTHLNGHSGFELLDYLSAETKIIVTASDENDIHEANHYGIYNCLLKPVTLEDFLWSIRKASSLPQEFSTALSYNRNNSF